MLLLMALLSGLDGRVFASDDALCVVSAKSPSPRSITFISMLCGDLHPDGVHDSADAEPISKQEGTEKNDGNAMRQTLHCQLRRITASQMHHPRELEFQCPHIETCR